MSAESKVAKEKKDLRSIMLGMRSSMDSNALEALSFVIQRNLISQKAWQDAKSVALYVSTKNEVATEYILDVATDEGKTIFLPRVRRGEKGLMDFAICHGPQDLKPGSYSIREPDPSLCPGCVFTPEGECPPVPDNIIVPPPDIFIIPGVAFDRAGHRLGFGGGYYDRFLANPLLRAHSKFIALAYNFQVLEGVPSESWDQPVDAICTDVGYFLVEN